LGGDGAANRIDDPVSIYAEGGAIHATGEERVGQSDGLALRGLHHGDDRGQPRIDVFLVVAGQPVP
jgi:hypothetical protein